MVDLILNYRILSQVVVFYESCFEKIILAAVNSKEAREKLRKRGSRENRS